MKRSLVYFLAAILMVIPAGCWNSVELDKRAIVGAVGIDKAEEKGKIMLTVEIMKPGGLAPMRGGGEKGKPTELFTTTGHTVFEAFREMTMQSDRKLYIEHNRILVIGEEVAREGIFPILDFLIRDHECRTRTLILVAKGKAGEALRAESRLEKILSKEIENLVLARAATSKAPEVDLHQFFLKLCSKTTSPVASRLELIKESGKEGEPPKLRLTSTAVFKGDKLAGWLDRPETRGMLWIINDIKSGIIVVESPKEKDKKVSLEIIRAGSKIKPQMKEGELVIAIEVNEEGNIGDQAGKVNLTEPEVIKSLERRCTEVIRNEMEACLKKAQKEFKADIFGFGEEVQRSFPQNWKELEKDWDEIFPELKVEITVNAKIRRSGVITEPVRPE